MTKRNALPAYHHLAPGEEIFALELSEERSVYYGEYHHFYTILGRVVSVGNGGYHVQENGYAREGFYSEQGKEIEKVITSCQGTAELDGTRKYPYGWSVEYSAWRGVSLDEAQSAVKVLGKIDKHLKYTAEKDGSPDTYGAWLIRVCKALGVTYVRIARNRDDYCPAWIADPDERQYRAYRLGEAKDAVNRLINQWQNEEKYARKRRENDEANARYRAEQAERFASAAPIEVT